MINYYNEIYLNNLECLIIRNLDISNEVLENKSLQNKIKL